MESEDIKKKKFTYPSNVQTKKNSNFIYVDLR